MTISDPRAALQGYLVSADKIARRLAASIGSIAPLFPLDMSRVEALDDRQAERLDAFLHRFASLAATVQDHVGRAMLLVEEEPLADASREDQRLLLEKLGALAPQHDFEGIAKLRNRLVHTYPSDARRQAEVLNEVFARSDDLLSSVDGLLDYARLKIGLDLGSPRVGRRP